MRSDTKPSNDRFSLLGAVAIGIGGMVGGGIFAVLGVAATTARGATPIAFAVAGVIAALTAYSYSRLSVHFQSAGGTVTFVDRTGTRSGASTGTRTASAAERWLAASASIR